MKGNKTQRGQVVIIVGNKSFTRHVKRVGGIWRDVAFRPYADSDVTTGKK
jgi:hypothetical protein